MDEGHRGLVGLFTTHGAKGRRFEPQSFFFLFLWSTTLANLLEPQGPLESIRLTLDVRVR